MEGPRSPKEGRSKEEDKQLVPHDPSEAFAHSEAVTEKLNKKQVEKLNRVFSRLMRLEET